MATVQQFMIASIIFVTVFAGLIIVYSGEDGFTDVYGLTAADRYFGADQRNTSQIEQAYNISKDITSKFDSSKSDQSNLDTSIVGGLNAIKQTVGMFDIVKKVINSIDIMIGIPTWLLNAILFAVLITVSLAVISAFLGRRTD